MRSPHTAMKSSPRLLQLEKVHKQQQRPSAAKKNKMKLKTSKNSILLYINEKQHEL